MLVSKILSLKDVEVFRAEKFGVRKLISYGSLPIFFMLIHAVIYCSGFLVYVLDLKRFYFYWDWIFYKVGNSTVVLSDSFLSSNFFILRLFLILLIKLSFSSSPFLIFYIFLSFITLIIFILSYHLQWFTLKYKKIEIIDINLYNISGNYCVFFTKNSTQDMVENRQGFF